MSTVKGPLMKLILTVAHITPRFWLPWPSKPHRVLISSRGRDHQTPLVNSGLKLCFGIETLSFRLRIGAGGLDWRPSGGSMKV